MTVALFGRAKAVRTGVVALALVAAATVLINCSGQAVIGTEQDPLACELEHECGSAFCQCGDGAILLTSLCEVQEDPSGNREECQRQDEVCERRCLAGDHGAPTETVKTVQGLGTVQCPQICQRLLVSGCNTGCESFFERCTESFDCSEQAEVDYACLSNEAIITCEEGAVAFSGCEIEKLEICRSNAEE